MFPRTVSQYKIVRSLGSGAMAEVFVGRTSAGGFEREVAIKRLLPSLAQMTSAVEMFIDEARICSELSHDGIAKVIDFGRDGDTYFLAMDYVEGKSLRELHYLCGLPPQPVAAYIVSQICAALEYAHTFHDLSGRPQSIVHRDVKPANVLITNAGMVKLIDFGVARAEMQLHQTVGLELKGSYAYMSPEQAVAGSVDGRSDIFSAGTVLYELLAGENPFFCNGILETVDRVSNGQATPLSQVAPLVSAELAAICSRAMSKELDQRYQSAGAMQADLMRFCARQGFRVEMLTRWVVERQARPKASPLCELPTVLAATKKAGLPRATIEDDETTLQGPLYAMPTDVLTNIQTLVELEGSDPIAKEPSKRGRRNEQRFMATRECASLFEGEPDKTTILRAEPTDAFMITSQRPSKRGCRSDQRCAGADERMRGASYALPAPPHRSAAQQMLLPGTRVNTPNNRRHGRGEPRKTAFFRGEPTVEAFSLVSTRFRRPPLIMSIALILSLGVSLALLVATVF